MTLVQYSFRNFSDINEHARKYKVQQDTIIMQRNQSSNLPRKTYTHTYNQVITYTKLVTFRDHFNM